MHSTRAIRPSAAVRHAQWSRGLLASASRRLHVNPAHSESSNVVVDGNYLPVTGVPTSAASRDARFDVVGAPYSLLSVSLSASQNLYTRRGTLVGLSGKADNVVSNLQLLGPFRRSLMRIPFLYQKVSSTSPVNALISTRSPVTTFATVEVDGTVDWKIVQRDALLAWTGHTLRVTPSFNKNLTIAQWGSSEITGRGLMALVGRGQVYSIDLKEGERYIVHPSNILAYTMTSQPPSPYRFKSTSLNLQIPDIGQHEWLSRSKFFNNMAQTETWRTTQKLWRTFKTWSRRTIWGDRLFLQFEGPSRILIQSRGPTISETLTTRQINEIADAPAGVTQEAVNKATPAEEGSKDALAAEAAPKTTKMNTATISRNGQVHIKPSDAKSTV